MAYKKYYELLLLCKHTILFGNSFSSLLLGRLCKQSRFTNRRKARRRGRLEKWKKYSILNYNNTKSEQHSSEYGVACVFLYFSLFFIFVFFCEVFFWRGWISKITSQRGRDVGERHFTFPTCTMRQKIRVIRIGDRLKKLSVEMILFCVIFFMLDLHLRHIMERGLITSLFSFAHNVASKPLQITRLAKPCERPRRSWITHTHTPLTDNPKKVIFTILSF